MPDFLMLLFLKLNNTPCHVAILVAGLICGDRRVFWRISMTLLLGILFCYALKITFKVPLPAHIGNGYAFPSGHMQSAFLLYGGVLFSYKNKLLRLLLIVILAGIAISTVQAGFHTYIEILGGIGSAGILMAFYGWIEPYPKKDLIIFTVATLLISYAFFVNTIAQHVWRGYFVLIILLFLQRMIGLRVKGYKR